MRRLSANNIEKYFLQEQQRMSALGPLDLEISPGEFICILGESGCGKSTFLRILAGLEIPTAGNVSMDDRPITGPDYRRAVVFQNPALLPWLTVQENISLGFKIRGERVPKDLVQQTIQLVGIDGFEKAKPKTLSGGMAQRAAIARALVSNPDVLLMDEPFGALDALTRMRMQEALIDIWNRHRVTIVFITHDIDEALVLASRIVVMTPRPGKIARVFDVSQKRSRARSDAEFLKMRACIADELVQSFKESREFEWGRMA